MTPHDDDRLPSIELAKRLTGLNEDELTRRFMIHLIDVEGKNPFDDMPAQVRRDTMQKYPDVVDKARRKFGSFNTFPPPIEHDLKSKARLLVIYARATYPSDTVEEIAHKIEGKMSLQFSPLMSEDDQQSSRSRLREIILEVAKEYDAGR